MTAVAMKRLSLLLVSISLLCVSGRAQTYRGMVDVAPALELQEEFYASGNSMDSYGYDGVAFAMAVSTTHGVQLSRQHYVGIGTEFCRRLDISDWEELGSIPVYAMWRMDFFGRKITPFFDVRAGYQVAKANGFYGNINGGVRFNLTGRTGLNVSLGVRIRRVEAGTGNWIKSAYSSWRDDYGRVLVRQYAFGFLMRIGVDF